MSIRSSIYTLINDCLSFRGDQYLEDTNAYNVFSRIVDISSRINLIHEFQRNHTEFIERSDLGDEIKQLVSLRMPLLRTHQEGYKIMLVSYLNFVVALFSLATFVIFGFRTMAQASCMSTLVCLLTQISWLQKSMREESIQHSTVEPLLIYLKHRIESYSFER